MERFSSSPMQIVLWKGYTYDALMLDPFKSSRSVQHYIVDRTATARMSFVANRRARWSRQWDSVGSSSMYFIGIL